MGDFSVSCGVSSISMLTDRVVLVPLVPERYSPMDDEGRAALRGAMIVTNDGACSLFNPLAFPLFGNIDSYGCLENIERDFNVECIEAYFGLTIDEFVEQLTRAWTDEPSNEKLKELKIAGMFIHRDIYDMMIRECLDEGGEPSLSAWDNGDITPYLIKRMGFKFQKEDKDRERYNRLYTHTHFPEVEIWSDDNRWMRLVINGKEFSKYCSKGLIEVIEEVTGRPFPEDIKDQLKAVSRFAIDYQELQEHKKLYDETTNPAMRRLLLSGRWLTLGSMYDAVGTTRFMEIYGEHLDEAMQPYADMQCLQQNLFSMNRLFMPTFSGPQYGNQYATKLLLETAAKVVDEKIAVYDE